MPRTTKREEAPGPEFTPEDYAEIPSPPMLPAKVEAAPAKPYALRKWKDVVDVYQCITCLRCDNSEDEMILHVLIHVPANEREQLFERLMKEKSSWQPLP